MHALEMPIHHGSFPGPDGAPMGLEATGPPKAKRAPAKSALRKLELRVGYRFWLIAQQRRAVRRCVACGTRVTNRNLGGHERRCALSSPLWCLDCADYSRQLVFSFGGI
jgi:hypothetical protein